MSDSFLLRNVDRPAASSQRRTVLVTGAAGQIGRCFAAASADRYDLRLMVRSSETPAALRGRGRCVRGDLADLDGLKKALASVDTIVHLAASAREDTPWQPLLHNNIIGTYNLFVAAQAARCRRVVFASSIHAVSGYPLTRQVQADDPVSPGDLYGVSKCFGEAMGRFMATQRGLSVIAVRIGAFQPVEVACEGTDLIDAFVSQRDLVQLLQRCIDDESLQFAIVHGLSGNAFNRMDISEAKMLLDYAPQDDFAQHNPHLRDLNLHNRRAHSERDGTETGLREEM